MAKTRSTKKVSSTPTKSSAKSTPKSNSKSKAKTSAAASASPSAAKSKAKKQITQEIIEIASEEPEEVPSKETKASIVADKQIDKAISELKKFFKQQSQERKESADKLSLFEDDSDGNENDFFVTVTTKKYYSDKPNFKPKQIKLTNSIRNDFNVCLIVRDNLITSNDQLETIQNSNIPSLSKIYTLTQIKTEFKPFEKRRQLAAEYNLFLADDAVINSLPSALGNAFYGRAKAPVSIKVTSTKNKKELSVKTLTNQFEKALSSTSFLPPVSNNVVVKAGLIDSFTKAQLVQNVQDVVKFFDEKLVAAIYVKTRYSPALPVFYTDKIYSSEDVIESKAQAPVEEDDEEVAYEKGLLEFADSEEVAKVLGKELRSIKTGSKTKAAKKAHPSTKPLKI